MGTELGYKYGKKWTRSPFEIELPLSADLIDIEFVLSYSNTVLQWMLRDLI